MPQMFDYSFKRLLFSRSWHYTGINECSCICKMLYWSHKLLKLLFFRNDYTFIITTNILTLMKIFFLVMKGKRCINNKKKFKKNQKRLAFNDLPPPPVRPRVISLVLSIKKQKKWNGLSLRTAEFWCFFLFLFGLFGHDPEFLEA